MAIRVALNHVTEYRYDRPVELQPHVIRLRPAPHCRTPILSYSLRVEPVQQFLNWQQDPYSNYLARIVFLKPAPKLRVVVDLVAELTALNPFDFFIDSSAEQYPFTYEPTLARELVPYLETLPAGPELQALIDSQRRSAIRTIDFIVELNRFLKERIRYVIRMEPGVQTPEETLTLNSGSCRDTGWLMVQLLRHLGLAARFVSGYLVQLTADEKALDGPSGPERDFTDLHAWADVYLPGAGWVGLDPTSGLLASEGHIPLACAADPVTAAAITGSFVWNEEEACQQEFHVAMSVRRIHETPRVTLPYTEEQWRAIDALGCRVDRELVAGDVRLTMGGEPTFVSLDNRDDAEWNTEALGPTKRRQAGTLLRRLRECFAPGALLHFGQGKWYPGESLPRWALGCYWRRDGAPIWHEPLLVADDQRDYGFDAAIAYRFISRLAVRLGIDPALALPGHEDAWYYLWREGRLPENVDPLKNNLDDPEERRRLAQVFAQGLNQIVGYALPLRRNTNRWESGRWALRRGHLFLTPGDSPMGYRLPLDSLPWCAPEDRDAIHERDPFAPRGPLAPPPPFLQTPSFPGSAKEPAHPGSNGVASRARLTTPDLVRTTLCVEPRAGRLYVFMPPQRGVEDYLDLIAAIEATAAEVQVPVLIEGYTPPSDHRLNHFQLTPDPGVMEVNIQPAHSWNELVHHTTTLYEEARQARLSTEKFMLDGRHTGTGGGNHIIIGGATPADSPILRRPDLLRSLLGYWHNHPALSYLFSGLFIGPTSQAPRIDEARHESVYELEIAFRQLPEGTDCPPWLVDRAFRHLLADATGNTHRTEFCIDKLYAPESATGRLGLLELRSFEMPPHARMSLVQQLLMRVLVARFWKKPYVSRLVRWGAALHDRFMLPHFVAQDFQDVLAELHEAGYPVEESWFATHLAFRFPAMGSVTYRDIHVELRQALEPWNVLGEEASSTGTARYVDSSVERLQVKVAGLTDSRHVLACNGRRVPLQPTGTNGEFVAGVRYRAWQPPSCLHPTIPVHTPLVFDLIDTWNGRSIGGCTYHVAHPGGLSPDDFPVNANAAEGRRTARFFTFGHTPGLMAEPPAEPHAEAPLTLDLRQPAPAKGFTRSAPTGYDARDDALRWIPQTSEQPAEQSSNR